MVNTFNCKDHKKTEINYAVDDVILEERCINDTVKNVSIRISNEIEEQLANDTIKTDIKSNLKYRTCEFTTNIFGDDILVKARLYYFNNEEQLNLSNIDIFGKYDFRRKTLTIIIPCINGYIDGYYFEGTIQHEITHHFQNVKTKNKPQNIMSLQLYDIGMNLIKNKNKWVTNIGWLIYYSLRDEETAFGNTMYAELKKHKDELWWEAYQKTNMYNTILRLKDINTFMENSNNLKFITLVVNKFFIGTNVTPSKLINLSKRTLNRYVKRTGKIISLLMDENILNEGRVSIDYKDDYNRDEMEKRMDIYEKVRNEK